MNQTMIPRTELPDFLTAFAGMHDAMCRDAERLVQAAPHLAATDLPALHRWWVRLEATIVHHHEREDDLVFPTLAARATAFEAVRRQLHEEHEALDRAMADLGVAIAGPNVNAIRPASVAFRDILVDHLGYEESNVFPMLAEHVSADEYAAIEREMQQSTPIGHMAFELPWVLDGADPRLEAMIAELLPAPVRLLNRYVFTPRYRRLAATVATSG